MTTDLEKQFFETFGIEPHKVYPPQDELFGAREEMTEFFNEVYPQITDRHYLQLLCWVNERRILPSGNVEDLKKYILNELCVMTVTDKFKHQVQKLFKGE